MALCNAPDRGAPFFIAYTIICLVSYYSEVRIDSSSAILRSAFVPQEILSFSESDCFIHWRFNSLFHLH